MEDNNEEPVFQMRPEERAYVKITRNSKGYHFEVKIYQSAEDTDETWLARLKTITTELEGSYKNE